MQPFLSNSQKQTLGFKSSLIEKNALEVGQHFFNNMFFCFQFFFLPFIFSYIAFLLSLLVGEKLVLSQAIENTQRAIVTTLQRSLYSMLK